MSEIDVYELDDLIEKLENIKFGFDQNLNFPKAFYSLALEIKKIREEISNLKKGQYSL